ncbi:MAG: metallophosphoesterase [Nitriliruptorales bacterium]|nr:metallophosphoesterase [Nitriliruptorales bacterium]
MTQSANRLLAGAVVAGAAALLWGTIVERRWYVLRHATVPVLSAAATQPLRVLHLSDLHQLPGHGHRLAFVRSCVDSGPDVVIVTGDLIESDEGIPEVVEALAEVARDRVALAVLGAHDYWGATARNPAEYLFAPERRRYGRRLDTRRLVDGLAAAGYEVMDNARQTVKTPAGLIDVLGLGDPHVDLDRPGELPPDPPSQEVALRLGLVHAPYRRALDALTGHGAQLVMTGHTHGGQLRVPFAGALVNNTDLPLRQSRGLSRYGGAWLHVSAGLGHSRFAPVRFSCRPEATILDFVAAPEASAGA